MTYGLVKKAFPRQFSNNFESIFVDVFSGFDKGLPAVADFSPAADVEETEKHYVLTLDVPGIDKKDIKIELKNDQLIVSGERKTEKKDKKQHYVERSYGKFERVWTLPDTTDTEKVEASYRDGVLEISVPKSEQKKAKVVPIH